VSDTEPKKPSWFDTNRLKILWGGTGSVVALLAGIIAIYDAVAPKDHRVPSASPSPYARLTTLSLQEHISRAEYMRRPEYRYAVDPMHSSASALSPEEAQQVGSVLYYSVDIVGSRPYDVKYEPWNSKRRPTGPMTQVRGIVPSDKFQDTQVFWVADDPSIAGIHVILAPNVPPPLFSDWKNVTSSGTAWP
jgi:hypothetical protein